MSKVRSFVAGCALFGLLSTMLFVTTGCEGGADTSGTQAKISAEQKASEDAARKATEDFQKNKGKTATSPK